MASYVVLTNNVLNKATNSVPYHQCVTKGNGGSSEVRDEDGCRGNVQCGAVTADSDTEGNDESGHSLVNLVLVFTGRDHLGNCNSSKTYSTELL